MSFGPDLSRLSPAEPEPAPGEEWEGDRWDWDLSDPAQRCRHGSFIGSWWGPDLLCQRCEDGEP